MNFTFSLARDNLVATTHWEGELDYEAVVAGTIRQNQWIIENSTRLPLVLVSDFTGANINGLTGEDLQQIASQFYGEEDLFPGVTWIAVMPKEVRYDIVRLWLEHAESMFQNSHVVKNQAQADIIIDEILERFADQV